MIAYQAHLELAEKELDVMESILKDGLDKDFEFDYSGENKDFSRSKL